MLVYKCDICGKYFDNKDEQNIKLILSYSETSSDESDICVECDKSIITFIEDNLEIDELKGQNKAPAADTYLP